MTSNSSHTLDTKIVASQDQHIQATLVDIPAKVCSLSTIDVGRAATTRKNTGTVILRYEPEPPRIEPANTNS